MKLDGTVVLITGASRGIGAEAARAFHDRGASVGLIARSGDELGRVAGELGSRVAIARADVGDRNEVEAAVADLTEALGPPAVLVNNAGIGAYRSVLEEEPSTFEQLMRVNYLGTVYPTRAVLPGMAERHRGHIVNVASVAGRLGAPFEAAYSASKFAVVGFSESLAAEVQGFGIRVSLVNPGPVKTTFTDTRGVPFQRKIPRPVKAKKIAEAICAAVEDDRFEQSIPRWLRVGVVLRAISPTAYRAGLLRDSRKESDELVARIEARKGARG